MNFKQLILAATAAVGLAGSASATLPTPNPAAATRDNQAFLFNAGAGDIFEITSSVMAIQHSQNPQVRAFASMLISDHTNLTNNTLATAKAAGVMAPPPELSPMQKSMLAQLAAASPASFDRVYLQQQLPAHQMALQMMQGYAAQGDVPQLRQAAGGAVPIVQNHIREVQQLLGSVR
ncbi:DUF4142 domain-containing protein [Sphingomonas ginkgonis]|nr:DUF4142 domain-containing protein [Sphingomonas ginkgonis]